MLLLCAGAALATISIVLFANASVADVHPEIGPWLWAAVGLGAVQLMSIILIWRAYIKARARFVQRLRAVTGGLNDRIFLADEKGMTFAVLTDAGWAPGSFDDWFESVHPDDRPLWAAAGSVEPRRIEVRLKGGDNQWRWHRLRATPLQDSQGNVREWVGTLHDIHEQKLTSERRDLLIGELRHRLKNLVTVIDALAKNSRRSEMTEPGVELFLQRFLGRLHALGTAGDLVLADSRGSIEVGALITATLAPFTSESGRRLKVGGPSLFLQEELGASLGLAVHELATNALKYGALSVEEGNVSFTWMLNPENGQRKVVFEWQERNGPAPTPPIKSGFGTRMIKHFATRRAGHVDIDYLPEGILCRIAFAVDLQDAPETTEHRLQSSNPMLASQIQTSASPT